MHARYDLIKEEKRIKTIYLKHNIKYYVRDG